MPCRWLGDLDAVLDLRALGLDRGRHSLRNRVRLDKPPDNNGLLKRVGSERPIWSASGKSNSPGYTKRHSAVESALGNPGTGILAEQETTAPKASPA